MYKSSWNQRIIIYGRRLIEIDPYVYIFECFDYVSFSEEIFTLIDLHAWRDSQFMGNQWNYVVNSYCER